MDQLTYDIWSMCAIIAFAGTKNINDFCFAFCRFNDVTRPNFAYLVELVLVYEMTRCIADHMALHWGYFTPELIVTSAVTYIMSVTVWERLTVKRRRWLKMALNILGMLALVFWVLHAHFGINAFMAFRTLWRRAVVPVIVRSIELCKAQWLRLIEFIASITWKEIAIFGRRAAFQLIFRWFKRFAIFMLIYTALANRFRRMWLSARMERLKATARKQKERVVERYKALSFRQKLLIGILATVSIFFVGKSYQLIYPILPRGVILRLVKLLRFIGTKLGLNKIMDKLTNVLVKIAIILLPMEIYDFLSRRVSLYKKWRLRRYTIMLDRWITIIDHKARDKARVARQVVIHGFHVRHRESSFDSISVG